jgi:replicative DNA helicase Mcm
VPKPRQALRSRTATTADPGLVERWERALGTEAIRPLVAQAQQHWGSILLDWWLLDNIDPLLADELQVNPTQHLRAAEAATATANTPALKVRVTRLSEAHRIRIRDLRHDHANRLYSIEGLVKTSTDVKDHLASATYQCLACECLITEAQSDPLHETEPLQCYKDQGGCGISTSFIIVDERSEYVNSQRLEIQEAPEGLNGADQPQRLTVILEGDLTGHVRPGDRVVINGIPRRVPKRKGTKNVRTRDRWLYAVSIEQRESSYEDVKILPEDEAAIQRLAQDPSVVDQLVNSLAPSIHGLHVEKEAIILQLFGGTERLLLDGARIRGDIHILLIGDPGVAKSQLLRAASRIAPRGVLASGKGASAAGLTASAVHDDVEGRWTFEAGALVLADRGLACIDELDKMTEEDRGAIHGALEQGRVNLNKAGLNLELYSRTSVLAAANPKEGRFDVSFGALSEQFDLEPPLLSRFDVIFPLVDKPEGARDEATIRHVLNREHVQPTIAPELLRKYVAHARTHVHPGLTAEAKERIVTYYVNLRKDSAAPDAPMLITPRQGEALERLATASARIRLSNEATPGDVDRAIRIMEAGLRRLAGKEAGGLWDLDKVATGTSHNQRQAISTVLGVIADLARQDPDQGAHRDQVLRLCRIDHGLPEERVAEVLERLHRDGRITYPRGGGSRMVVV